MHYSIEDEIRQNEWYKCIPAKQTSNVTFVTAFMNIYDKPLHDIRDIAWRFDHFAKIVETGIPLCVYVDQSSEEYMRQFIELLSEDGNCGTDHVKIMRVMNITDTWIHKECLKFSGGAGFAGAKMPKNRTQTKDTYEYMVLMHSKVEFLKDAIEQNPWSTKYFSWIDFNIWHIFKDSELSRRQLCQIAYSEINTDSILIPGCWSKMDANEELVTDTILNSIHWRFCGGFILGHQDQIMDLWNMYQKYWPIFMDKYGDNGKLPMLWEVNFWTWLEAFHDWKPTWYSADHDDRIIQIPVDTFTTCLKKHPNTTVEIYNYKEIPQYYPMSSSYTLLQGGRARILNTRYVNYRLTPQGAYIFNDPNKVIASKNVFSVLDQEWQPVNYQEIANPVKEELPSKLIPECPFDGIEDIRIFCTSGNEVEFIGTSINYSKSESNRMIYGTYDLRTYQLNNCFLLDPPRDSWCEKNWCPIIYNMPKDSESSTKKPLQFIYSWNPIQIGELRDVETTELPRRKRLEITITHQVNAPLFKRFNCRGSTSFVESIYYKDYLIGVVHFSLGEWPRNYYHSLVLLDKITLQPKFHSNMFTFCNSNSIEFCIGFTETNYKNNEFIFWISQFDRDPCMISASLGQFSWLSC